MDNKILQFICVVLLITTLGLAMIIASFVFVGEHVIRFEMDNNTLEAIGILANASANGSIASNAPQLPENTPPAIAHLVMPDNAEVYPVERRI